MICISPRITRKNDKGMLDRTDILSLTYMFVKWPREGIDGILENVPPREYQEGVVESEFASAELKALAKCWLENGVDEVNPFEEKQHENQSWDISLFGEVGYPKRGEFVDKKTDSVVDASSVRASVKILYF